MILKKQNIDGVLFKELVVHSDKRGRLFEILRADDPYFVRFGQVFSNLTKSGAVRNFHKHLIRITTFCCIKGKIKVVLIDEETESLNEFILSGETPSIMIIPPGIFYGWKTISEIDAITINVSTEPFNPQNPDTTYLEEITPLWKYEWV